jgi:peptidoglycan/LPS O-acetylase OafA/YrhL
VVGVVFWTAVKSYLDDPIYLMTFLVTLGMCAPATIALMMRRGDSRGTGVRQMWAAYLGIGVAYISVTTGLPGGPFRSPAWLVAAAVCLGLAVAMLAFAYRAQRPTPLVRERPSQCVRNALGLTPPP